MGDLIKLIFSSTVKCVRKCGGEWVKLVQSILQISIHRRGGWAGGG